MKVMRKVLSALLLLLLFCGSAAANIAFTTVDANYTTAAVGVIDDKLAASTVLSNLESDHYATSFVKGGKRLFVFLEHDYTTGDRAAVYGDTRTWKTPANVVWTNAINVHGVAEMNNFLYATSYGEGSVVQLSTSDYRATARYYIHKGMPAGYKAHGEKVLAVDGRIYALFGITSGSYPSLTYGDSELVELDGNLSPSEAVFGGLGANAVDMAYIGGRKIAVACLGGNQKFGVNGSVQVVNLDAKEGEDPLVSELTLEAEGKALGQISAICADGSSGGFYFIAQKRASADAKYPSLTLYHHTGSTQYPVKVYGPVDVAGYSCRLVLDTTTPERRLFALMGDRIVAVASNGTVSRVFSSTALGGNPSSIAVIDAGTGGTPGSGDGTGSGSGGGGGCDVSGFGVLALVALLGLRRRNVR